MDCAAWSKEQQDVFYYITVMNENYTHPAMPTGAEAGILKGMYLFSEGAADKKAPRVQLMGSGTILREVIAAAELLKKDFGVLADIWSCPSFTELRREGMQVERWNLLHPEQPQGKSYVGIVPGRASRARPWRPRTTWKPSPTRSDPSSSAPTGCLGPMGSGARIFASSCVSSSRSIATTSLWPRSRRWPTTVQCLLRS